MFKYYHKFASLRSDAPNVINVLEKYVKPGKLVITDISTYNWEGTWVAQFQVKGKHEEYKALRDELDKCWLLLDEEL
jgi:hypothetical protein